jgi:Fic family protein
VGEKAQAFVPAPLPPRPPIDWTPELRSKFDQALLALGRLDSVSTLLPDTSLFLYMYVRKEAVLSDLVQPLRNRLHSKAVLQTCFSQGAFGMHRDGGKV